jgi:hypothetical protein
MESALQHVQTGYSAEEIPSRQGQFQNSNRGIDDLRALDEFAVEHTQNAATAYDPGASRKGVHSLPHPFKKRTPGLLVHGEEEENVAEMYAFVRRAVVLWQNVRAQLYEHRCLS